MQRTPLSLAPLVFLAFACGGDGKNRNAAATPTPTPIPTIAPLPTPTPDASCDRLLPIESGQYGSLIDRAEFRAQPQTLPPWAFRSGSREELPARRVLDNLPAVGKQGTDMNLGSPGTCEAWSFGYGLGSYTAARFSDGQIRWDPGELANTASTAFLWSILVDDDLATCPSGGFATPYLQRLVAYGSASSTQVPYEPSCCYLDSVDAAVPHPDEDRFRIGSFSTFELSADQLDLMRALIDSGHLIAFSGLVYEHYDDPELNDGVFGSNGALQPTTNPGSGHAQLIIGYDDAKGDPSAPGAFLIQNSFGEQWPPASPGGRIWWAYETFFRSQSLAAVAYSLPSSLPSEGALDSSVSAVSAYVRRAFQWVDPDAPEQVSLILELDFSAPVRLETIEIVEPETGTQVTQSYDVPIASGYVFFRRQDGFQFLNGEYALALDSIDSAGNPVRFSGRFILVPSIPTEPEPMPIASSITATIADADVVIHLGGAVIVP